MVSSDPRRMELCEQMTNKLDDAFLDICPKRNVRKPTFQLYTYFLFLLNRRHKSWAIEILDKQ